MEEWFWNESEITTLFSSEELTLKFQIYKLECDSESE